MTALLFARSGLYAERSQRPGLSRIVGSLFQVAFVALIFAVVSGEHFSSYYIFYGSLGFALFYISSLRYVYERVTGAILHAAGYQRRAVLVGTGKHIHDVAHALADAPRSPIEVVGFVSPEPLPPNGVRCLGTLDHLQGVIVSERVDEVIIADPDFPQERAVELVDQCHRRGVRVRIAPSTMEILIHRAEFVPGQSVPLFELGPPVFEGIDFALKRTFDLVGSILLLDRAQPAACRDHACRARLLARTGLLPLDATRHRPAPLRLLEVPHDVLRRARAARTRSSSSTRPRARSSRSATTRVSRRSVASCGASRWTSCPQLVNVLRGEMSLVGPRPLPERDFELLEDWHRKRYLVLPGITGPVAGLGPLGARLRRSRAPRLHLPGALVAGARPGDPVEDDSRCDHAARGLLNNARGERLDTGPGWREPVVGRGDGALVCIHFLENLSQCNHCAIE